MPMVSDLHKAQTERFIYENTHYVILRRFTRVPDGAGGMMPGVEEVLDPQEVRVVHQVRPTPRVTADGRDVLVDKAVVGLDTFDVEIGDTFTFTDQKYEVINVRLEPFWHRTVAEAIHHG